MVNPFSCVLSLSLLFLSLVLTCVVVRVMVISVVISATKFKAGCLELMDRVHDTGEEVTITKHGKPVAKLGPVTPQKKTPREIFGCAKASITIIGDIVAPMDKVEWSGDEENVLRS